MITCSYTPPSSLRAFEATARHLSFTRTVIEFSVTHSAINQHVKALEQQLNCQLFVRGSHGLVLTTEGESLSPVLNNSFDRMAGMLDRFATKRTQEKLKIGVAGTFAVECLFPLLGNFRHSYLHVDSHISTHNSCVDPAAKELDYTVRYGGRAWHDTDAQYLCSTLMPPLCSPTLASQIQTPASIPKFPLSRLYRRDEWTLWMQAAGEALPSPTHNVVVLDSSITMLEAAQAGIGVVIAPVRMLTHLLSRERIVQPLSAQIDLGSHWITRLQSHPETPAMRESSR